MEKEESQQVAPVKKSWWRVNPKGIGGYIVAGAVWYYSQRYTKTRIDGLIVLIVVIAAWFFFYRVHKKLSSIKNYILRDISAFLIVVLLSVFVVVFLVTLF